MSVDLPVRRKSDFNLQKVDTHTSCISNSVSLCVYSDTEPHNLKISKLQKGLILVVNGAEAVGEGTGFGLPVVVYSDETCFSGTSELYVSQRGNCCVIVKEFTMDRIARNTFGNVRLENRAARRFIEHLSKLYQDYERFRILTLKGLTGRMNIGKEFMEAAPRGKITITYTIEKQHVTVKACLKKLEKKGLRKTFMLNEQGTGFFRKYNDSLGTELVDGKIGAWDLVGGEWACLKTLKGEIGFRLWNVSDAVLRRGREFLDGSLDWVGLDYEISRKNDTFRYVIDFLGV
jgi:hypothetical protein